MANNLRQRLEILEDLQRDIVFSSVPEQYARSILRFLQKKVQAQTVFLAFWDTQNHGHENPVIFGKPLTAQCMGILQKCIGHTSPVAVQRLEKHFLIRQLTLPNGLLGWVGASSAGAKTNFAMVCKSLMKDFFFLKEQLILRQNVANLNTIYNISQAVSETLNLDKLLESIVGTAMQVLHAQASSLGLSNPLTQEITFTVAKGQHQKPIRQMKIKRGEGIIGAVIASGKSLVIADAQKDKRFFRNADKKTGFTTHSILCVPMKVRNTVIGALEVINPTDRPAFTADQIPILYTLAQEAAVSIENARLFQLATTDGLTGLATIRYFRTLLDYEMSRAARYGRALSLILLDIDFFKKINDGYGHLVGDFILKELAKIIRISVRQMDVTGRYGGEEFIAFLPEASLGEALVVAERIRRAAEKTKFADGKNSLSITVSVGVATALPAETNNSLIARADKKMYEAKESGRNRVCS